MRSEYTKQGKSRYRAQEKKYEAMTLNRQIDYGYRGTTPNYVFNLRKEPIARRPYKGG